MIYVSTCGWFPDEDVKIEIITPDGRLVIQEYQAIRAGNAYGVQASYQTSSQELPGVFTFKYISIGRDESVEHSIHVSSTRPSIRRLEDGKKLLLRDFVPGESLDLLVYELEENWGLASWEDGLYADPRGHLILELEQQISGVIEFVVIGRDSGEVTETETPNFYGSSNLRGKTRFICPNAPSAYLILGRPAYVKIEVLEIHAEPTRSSFILNSVGSGSKLHVLEGPVCNDGVVWWKVRLLDGMEGWIIEGIKTGFTYFYHVGLRP